MSSFKCTESEHFGDIVQFLLNYRKLSQNEFAKSVKKKRSYISMLVNKQMGEPRFSTVRVFEKALGVEIRKTENGWEAYDHNYNPKNDPIDRLGKEEIKRETHTYIQKKTNQELLEAQEAVQAYEKAVDELITNENAIGQLHPDTSLQLVKSAIELLQAFVKGAERANLKKD